MSVRIRDADLSRDRSALERFILSSNAYEAQWESDRRLDAAVGADHLADLIERAKAKQGRIFVAEGDTGDVIGWAMCHLDHHEAFVERGERPFGYVAEMYVEESMRGRHIGRSLLKSCEDHFRALRVKTLVISALSPNARARNAYGAAGYTDYVVNLRKVL